jgi:stringent starvation protein B
MNDMGMTPNRPYIIRALYEWITDNHLTPHLLINADVTGVEVPARAIQQNKVVLNIDPGAVEGLDLGNEWLLFNTRFAGVKEAIRIPVEAIIAVYARENGQGMMFAQDEDLERDGRESIESGMDEGDDLAPRKPHLTLIK